MTDLDLLLKQADEHDKAATPEPWDARVNEFSNTARARFIWTEYGFNGSFDSESAEVDAAFTCWARSAVPQLVAAVRELRDSRDAWKKHHLDVTCEFSHTVSKLASVEKERDQLRKELAEARERIAELEHERSLAETIENAQDRLDKCVAMLNTEEKK